MYFDRNEFDLILQKYNRYIATQLIIIQLSSIIGNDNMNNSLIADMMPRG